MKIQIGLVVQLPEGIDGVGVVIDYNSLRDNYYKCTLLDKNGHIYVAKCHLKEVGEDNTLDCVEYREFDAIKVMAALRKHKFEN